MKLGYRPPAIDCLSTYSTAREILPVPYLNTFAPTVDAVDLTGTDEFASLCESAADLGITHADQIRYVSRNKVINHLRLHLLEWGEPTNPTILLLHGGNQSAHSWDLVALHLADRFHIIAPDQRGHGDSEWARDADYGPDQMASDALQLIHEDGIDHPIVMGHSMGGMVTMRLTARQPSLPRAVVLVDVGPEVSQRGAQAIRNFVVRNVEFEHLDEFIDRVAAYDPFRSREHMERTARYNLVYRSDGKYVSKSDRILHDPGFRRPAADRRDVADGFHQFDGPTLLVRGESSNILEADAAERFVDDLPNARLVEVSDCGHNVHSQNTPGFIDAVSDFLLAASRDKRA
ncbi:MAG: alpha/beta hydrolase [Chloroflexi bacterium]|nr:alpha/beta hydrolase [Chloroflexota bacterium]